MWNPAIRFSQASRSHSTACPAFIHASRIPSTYRHPSTIRLSACPHRSFHDYFITHIPSTSLHPDSGSPPRGPHHKLPRDKSTPHDAQKSNRVPAAVLGTSREMTVVRIPLKSAKHHFGVSLSRGMRPYNEDAYQAGTIDIPAFAKRRPMSLSRRGVSSDEVTPDVGATGDPQVFYFGVFDGHGGAECSGFLREQLHEYLEQTTQQFKLKSSLLKPEEKGQSSSARERDYGSIASQEKRDKESLEAIQMHTPV